MGTRKTSPGRPSYREATTFPVRSSDSPITVFGGAKKSRTLVPSRRNSGLTATPKPVPARRPDASSRMGTSSSAQVPGSMVERKTTTCPGRSARPICSATRSRKVVDRLPLGADGVPTQTSDSSVAATASAASVVARSAPRAVVSAISSPMRSSTMGACSPLMRSTLAGLTSTPTT